MRIHGKEIGFTLTMGASAEIAKMCPDGDIKRIGELLDTPYADNIDFQVRLAEALNKGYVEQKKWEGENCDRLGQNELLSLSPQEFNAVVLEAMAAFTRDSQGEIDTVEPKEAKKNNAEGDENSP